MLPQVSVTMAAQMLFFSFLILFCSFPGDFQALAHMPYDHSFTHECLATPLKPQYGGGIAVNPELNQGSEGWTQVGSEKVEVLQENDGNNFIVASRGSNRTAVVQTFLLEADKLYTFSAWVQSSCGDAYAQASFDTGITNITAGWVTAQEGCWSMLKGGLVVNASGLVVNASGLANLFFQMGDNSSVADIWVDNISLQPFTQEEWKSHQELSVEEVRKSRVIFQAVDEQGLPVSNTTISIVQTRPYFPFGNAMNLYILENSKYQEWFTSRFKYYTVFENEMKWASVNAKGSVPDYNISDAMLEFSKSNGLSVRGHTVHWGSKGTLPGYLQSGNLDPKYFQAEADKHTESIVGRYKGQLIHWDVVNENIAPNEFETILGENASTHQYQKVHDIDPEPLLFLNQYHTIEKSENGNTSAWKYLQKIWQLRRQGYNGPLAIGLQGHFNQLNLPYIRSSLDVVQSANLPVWVTELDVANATAGKLSNVAVYLEQIMREIHAHRAVKGLMMWSAVSKYRPGPDLCYKMCLTDINFMNLPTGDVVDKMLAEWSHAPGVQGTTNDDGYFETSLFHGEYETEISDGNVPNSVKFRLTPGEAGSAPLLVKICVN